MTPPDMSVNGVPVPAAPGETLLAACLRSGLDIPYFCWHPALGAVGSCRQCAVKIFENAGDESGKIVMACMTAAAPGMRVTISDATAQQFREQVLEMTLVSHPHDCPVCEVGGECHLQDMAVMTGHARRRSRFEKRTHLNQDLGPFIKHEMNRCIGCYRCVRFYKDYAGGEDFGVFGASRNVYFGRAADGALESAFAGNLVEICPTGVFVDKPFTTKFRRKWDMRATPAICPHCAVGCNITVHEHGGQLRRVVNRVAESLNGYFICDRGRFGTGFVQSPARLLRGTPDGAAALAAMLYENGVVGIGSPRASLESNFALRALVGTENFYAGVNAADAEYASLSVAILRGFRAQAASIADIARADAIIILGDDPLAVAPVLGLALLQTAKRAKTCIVATPMPTGLDRVATKIIRSIPATIIDYVFSSDILDILRDAQAPVLIVGGTACGIDLLRGAANILLDRRTMFCSLLPENNSLGLALMDPKPLTAAAHAKHVIVLEDDLSRRGMKSLPNATVAVLDHVQTMTTGKAGIILPIASFADADGTYVNHEGRVQQSFKALFDAALPPPAWRVLRDAGIASGRFAENLWPDHAELLRELTTSIPALAGCIVPKPSSAAPRPGWHSLQSALLRPETPTDMFLFKNAKSEFEAFARPAPAMPTPGLIFVAAPDIFRGDELASLSPAIAARAGAPEVILAPSDAATLKLAGSDEAICTIGDASFRRVVVVDDKAASCVAVITTGLPGEPPIPSGQYGTIRLAR